MPRRAFIAASAATARIRLAVQAAHAQAAPVIVTPDAAHTLRVNAQADLTGLAPVWTTAVVTRNHACLVYDQPLAVDANSHPEPQMADGWQTDADGKTWLFTLRERHAFHHGTPVVIPYCVASIRRWQARESVGQPIAAITDEPDAPDDRTIRFRLKHSLPLLTLALGKPGLMPLFFMPERLSATDPFRAITDTVGSGPFRFLKDECDRGSRAACLLPGLERSAEAVFGQRLTEATYGGMERQPSQFALRQGEGAPEAADGD